MTKLLKKPPIREAVIEIRFKTEIDYSVNDLYSISKSLSPDFEIGEKEFKKGLTIKLSEEGAQGSTENMLMGYNFKNKNKGLYLKVRKNSFAVGKLSPYISWDNFFNDFKNMWKIFTDSYNLKQISRVGVRFINAMEIPAIEKFDFDEYLTSCPKVPDELPNKLCKFFTQIVIPCDLENTFLTINQNMEGASENDEFIGVILDIDAYSVKEYNYKNIGQIESTLEKLRIIKNKAFFNSVTNKLLEIFNS